MELLSPTTAAAGRRSIRKSLFSDYSSMMDVDDDKEDVSSQNQLGAVLRNVSPSPIRPSRQVHNHHHHIIIFITNYSNKGDMWKLDNHGCNRKMSYCIGRKSILYHIP